MLEPLGPSHHKPRVRMRRTGSGEAMPTVSGGIRLLVHQPVHELGPRAGLGQYLRCFGPQILVAGGQEMPECLGLIGEHVGHDIGPLLGFTLSLALGLSLGHTLLELNTPVDIRKYPSRVNLAVLNTGQI